MYIIILFEVGIYIVIELRLGSYSQNTRIVIELWLILYNIFSDTFYRLLRTACTWFLEITFIPPVCVCVSTPEGINN